MAAINNIAATFASALSTTTDHHSPPISSASFSSSSVRPITASIRPIIATWNPHTVLPLSSRSSLLSLYGPPGPLPLPRRAHPPPPPLLTPPLSFLAGPTLSPVSVSVSSLSVPRPAILLSLPGAFLPCGPHAFSPSSFLRRSAEMRWRGAGTVGIVSANDVFVMRAWGEALGAPERGVMMLSDREAALARAVGMEVDYRGGSEGLGVRSEGFCVVVEEGKVKALFVNGDHELDDVIRAI